jgi:hypothetical protein
VNGDRTFIPFQGRADIEPVMGSAVSSATFAPPVPLWQRALEDRAVEKLALESAAEKRARDLANQRHRRFRAAHPEYCLADRRRAR